MTGTAVGADDASVERPLTPKERREIQAWAVEAATVRRYFDQSLAASIQPVAEVLQAQRGSMVKSATEVLQAQRGNMVKSATQGIRAMALPDRLLQSLHTGVVSQTNEMLARHQAALVRSGVGPVAAQFVAQQNAFGLLIRSAAKANPDMFAPASPELQTALRRVNELALLRVAPPAVEDIHELREMLEAGGLDAATVSAAELRIESNASVTAAVDDAAELLADAWPLVSRSTARKIVVLWVHLMWTAVLIVWLSTPLTEPIPAELRVLPGALGVLGAKDIAG